MHLAFLICASKVAQDPGVDVARGVQLPFARYCSLSTAQLAVKSPQFRINGRDFAVITPQFVTLMLL